VRVLSRIYQIIVLEVKDGQTPDVNVRVTRYYENRTKGEPYITAEFKAEDFEKYKNFVVGDGQLLNARRRRKRAAGKSKNYYDKTLNTSHIFPGNVLATIKL
jgi:hypothetical protein